VSRQPVTLPWSPDSGAFAQSVPRKPAGFATALLSLDVESTGDQPAFLSLIEPKGLKGSTEVPRSLLVLKPGQTALIRAPSQWSAPNGVWRDAILRQPHGMVQLRAKFHTGTVYAQSDNAIAVRVVPRSLG